MTIDSVSLIPYLASGNSRFHLSLFSKPLDSNAHSTTLFPFPVVSDAAPFTRVLSATLQSDAGQDLLPLLLFTQKDAYSYPGENLRPVGNVLIEQQWRDLFSRFARPGTTGAPLILEDQIGHQGAGLPFQPLFLCRLKQVYFPPVCPCCGQVLRLCRDDKLLAKCGLESYSKTLARYLFCDPCAYSDRNMDFYVPETRSGDPGFLIDQAGLIRKMGSRESGPDHGEATLPCLRCTQWQACYGTAERALSRIVVFSFFPFYMLLFNADNISARDREKLESGEALDQWESVTGESVTGEPITAKAIPGETIPEKKTPEKPVIPDAPPVEEKPIASVLQRILNRWQTMAKPGREEERPRTDPELAATLILSAKGSKQADKAVQDRAGAAAAPGLPEVPAPGQTDEDLIKTRIFHAPRDLVEPERHTVPNNAVELEKTRILARPPIPPKSVPSGEQSPAGKPGESANRARSAEAIPAPEKKPPKSRDDETTLEKTILIPREKAKIRKNDL